MYGSTKPVHLYQKIHIGLHVDDIGNGQMYFVFLRDVSGKNLSLL